MKKIIIKTKKGYRYSWEPEVQDVIFVAFCCLIIGACIIRALI